MILKVSIKKIEDDDVFPSTNSYQDVFCFGDMNWNWFNLIINRSKVYKKSDIILCQLVLWLVSSSLFSLNKTWAHRLYNDVMFLRNQKYSLVREVVHDLLLQSFEVVVVSRNIDFVSERPF